jgi:hypothetical protein
MLKGILIGLPLSSRMKTFVIKKMMGFSNDKTEILFSANKSENNQP